MSTRIPVYELPEIIKDAAMVHAAIGADLSGHGGVLRCTGDCKREQELGDIAAYLRDGWPECCGYTMTWVTQRLLARERREIPDGYELVAVPDEDRVTGWRIDPGRKCRRRGCGKPSVASRVRGFKQKQRWAYCESHMYGRWIEDGQVMHWILQEVTSDA
jgi:hypothetical protein